MKRPEYEKHIRKNLHRAYCGADILMAWAFVDLTHANNSQKVSRFTVCPECLKEAQNAKT